MSFSLKILKIPCLFISFFGLVCDLSAPIKICCDQFSPALFFQRAYSLEHTQNCLRFRRFFSSFTVVLPCYLWLFKMSSVCKSYQIIVVIVKNYQVNYEVSMKRERHNFLSQMPLLLFDQEININGFDSKLWSGAMNRPYAVLSALSHELLWTLTIPEFKTVDCSVSLLSTELHGLLSALKLRCSEARPIMATFL